MTTMNIGQAAAASGLSAKMIRHYEGLGLITQPQRTDAGYRQYSMHDVHVLRFIARARDLGFSIQQIGELLSLWRDRRRPSRKVKELVLEHVQTLDEKIKELLQMKAALERLGKACRGDHRPECPIIDVLSSEGKGHDAPRALTKRTGQLQAAHR